MFQEDTIAAIATAVGEGGIGIIRLSGAKALTIADGLFMGVSGRNVPDILSYQAAFGYIMDSDSQSVIDEVLLLVMRAPRSYTREDVVEIHSHGGVQSLKKILTLTLQAGARLAEPGEFTKRAFLNGRLDLTQAEAVIDVIRAKTEASLKMSMSHLSGGLSNKIRDLRYDILKMIAQLEAAIDFPEEDIELLAAGKVGEEVKGCIADIDTLLASAHTGRILRDGLETVIIGRPNVGKSSLLNALLGVDRAIVTDIPGTTRDVIEDYVNIRGIPLKIIDTAGIRETADIIERMGVDKAKKFMERADLVLLILDASWPISHEDREIMAMLQEREALVLVNKSDLPPRLEKAEILQLLPGKQVIPISVLEGMGMKELEEAIVNVVYSRGVYQAEENYVNNVRHIHLLSQARQHLADVLSTILADMPPDCIVVDLRAAWDALGEITGDTVGEDIIDQIFSQFCIGK